MKNNKKSVGAQSGFTLIEVLLAVLILSAGLLTLAAVFAQGAVILVNTPVQLAAKEWAYEIIDEIAIRKDAGLEFPTSYPPREINGRELNANAVITDTGFALRVQVTITYPINNDERRYVTTVLIDDIN